MDMKTIKMGILSLGFTLLAGCNTGNPNGGIDTANMDLEARPGTDFFEYCCGGWLKAHPLTPEYSRFGVTEQLFDENEKQVRKLIEELASKKQEKGTLEQKIGSLYNLAMDSTRRNREGMDPVRPLLEKVNAVQDLDQYQQTVAELSQMGIPARMFRIGADADDKNAEMNIVEIGQGGLSLRSRDYYVNNDSATVKVRNAYKKYISQLFQLAGDDSATAKRKMETVLDIETRIAQVNYSMTKLRDVEGNYHKVTYAQLKEQYPGIAWDATLKALGYPEISEVNLRQPEPIGNVAQLLQKTPLEDLKTYASFKVLHDAADALDDRCRSIYFEFSKTLSGAQVDRPRWKRAVGVVDNVLGMALGKIYVEKYFPESSKQRMLELVDNLKAAFAERIKQVSWREDSTKQQALKKLETFIVKIGYPDEWRDYDGLTIDDSLSFYENMCNAAAYENQYEIDKRVNKPVDRKEWFMTPQTINAYYNPTTNEICFPAGILQPPFFNPEADDAVNYGAIGSVIGHEMTHGFDDQGSQYDETGNMKNWWTKKDKADFEKRTQVMADFFSGIEAQPGLKINGQLTLGENLADNGGLKIAYDAYRKAWAGKDTALVDENGFTPDQRFFISYGFSWTEAIRPELERRYITTDPHAPAKWRVNGALPHIDAWYRAFDIQPGDSLYLPKEARVDVW